MEELLKYLVKALLEDKEAIEVTKNEDEKTITYVVKVAEADLGKVIGKNGKMAGSIRTIMRSTSSKSHKKVFIKFEG